MQQLELDFGEEFAPVPEDPWMGEEFILAEQACTTIDKTLSAHGWHYLLGELVRWEVPFAVIPGEDRSQIEVYYSPDHEHEFSGFLAEAYNLRELAHG